MADQRPLSPDQASHTRDLLIQAGYREARHATIYQGIRVLFATVGFLAVLAIWRLNSPPLLVGVTCLGFFIPRFFLKHMINDRQTRIRLGLIDALDLITLYIGPGVGPAMTSREAMKHVTEDLRLTYPELHDELYFVCRDINAGYSWDEALDAMSE